MRTAIDPKKLGCAIMDLPGKTDVPSVTRIVPIKTTSSWHTKAEYLAVTRAPMSSLIAFFSVKVI